MCSNPMWPAGARRLLDVLIDDRRDSKRRHVVHRSCKAAATGCPRATGNIQLRAVGFTLVEVMVVIVLIGLLAGAVAVGTRSYLISGKQAVAKMEIAHICQAIDTFYAAYDRYPTNEEGTAILARPNEKFAEGLIKKVPLDPWGHAYEYLQPGRDAPYEVVSYGADGREGGQGADRDITSRDLDDETLAKEKR